jgi:S1-C subfamily serine protease
MPTRAITAGIFFILLGLFLTGRPLHAKKGAADKVPATAGADDAERRMARELPAAALFGRISPSVVVVEVATEAGKSQGSGVVIGPEQVVTNHHVVASSKGAQVRQGKLSWLATIETLSVQHDLAILRVPGMGLPRATMRPSNQLAVGERVYAVGAPRGLELSLSDGLVSGLRREKHEKTKKDKAQEPEDDTTAAVIQTTAPVSPGSSGGGLFDGQGRLVGIMTFVVRGGQGLNFAHPTEWVEELRAGKASAGAAPTKNASAGYGLSQRPTSIRCTLDTRAVWGLFSGGAEILETEPVKSLIQFDAFAGQTPSYVSTVEREPRKGDLVLADMNREAGFIHFTSPAEQATGLDYFFSVDDDGRFRLTLIKPFDFHGQVRVSALSGACQVPDSFAKNLCKQGDIKSCLAEGAALEEGDRAAALTLYLKGCSRSTVEEPAQRALAADACLAAARVADAMGANARAEGLRQQAAQLRAPKGK